MHFKSDFILQIADSCPLVWLMGFSCTSDLSVMPTQKPAALLLLQWRRNRTGAGIWPNSSCLMLFGTIEVLLIDSIPKDSPLQASDNLVPHLHWSTGPRGFLQCHHRSRRGQFFASRLRVTAKFVVDNLEILLSDYNIRWSVFNDMPQ